MVTLNNITVVGGGTAGWLSACYIKKFFPTAKLTVIESDKIDIIGVGESTTPQLFDILRFLDVPIQDLINEVGTTFKSTIKFTNWTGDGTSYHHGFTIIDPSLNISNNTFESVFTNRPEHPTNHRSDLATFMISRNKNLDDIHFSSIVARKNKVPVVLNKDNSINAAAHFAIHFNAVNFAKYMKKYGIQKGIESRTDFVKDCVLDENGFVSKLILDRGEIETDFVIDATGFSRILVNKKFNAEFDSYKSYLPMKRAAPFFVDMTKEIPPYTEAKAMKNGWMWKIPIQDRYGCGYVFDSNYASDEEIYSELCKEFNKDIEINKFIGFEPGYFKTPWNKNVLAVGLASGFIEPLEATSIWIITISLVLMNKHLEGIFFRDERNILEYNKQFTKSVRSIMNLVQLHYLGKRSDTNFWKSLTDNMKLTDFNEEYLDFIKYRMPNIQDQNEFLMFNLENWLVVSAGINLFDKEMIKKTLKSYNISNNIMPVVEKFKLNANNIADSCIEHKDFIEIMRNIKG